MIDIGVTADEIHEILTALTGEHGERYATPSLVAYLRGKEMDAKLRERRKA